ncbi:hypothetical protein LHK94_09310 [Dickeya zeae]|uniref:hypothetical protein n=1 Tax=Dickeya zeae TaxID=204042 RepID=UPI0003AB1CC3|nr:hypothetical protein [Dickeya zeae]UCZ77140.1 hypothetical protein LHK94_09310 [Dickeya zeae]
MTHHLDIPVPCCTRYRRKNLTLQAVRNKKTFPEINAQTEASPPHEHHHLELIQFEIIYSFGKFILKKPMP